MNPSFKPCLMQNFLAHSLGPILFSPYTSCDNSNLVSKMKMVSPVLIILLGAYNPLMLKDKGGSVCREDPAEKCDIFMPIK